MEDSAMIRQAMVRALGVVGLMVLASGCGEQVPRLTRDHAARLAYQHLEQALPDIFNSVTIDVVSVQGSNEGYSAQAKLWLRPVHALGHKTASLGTIGEHPGGAEFTMSFSYDDDWSVSSYGAAFQSFLAGAMQRQIGPVESRLVHALFTLSDSIPIRDLGDVLSLRPLALVNTLHQHKTLADLDSVEWRAYDINGDGLAHLLLAHTPLSPGVECAYFLELDVPPVPDSLARVPGHAWVDTLQSIVETDIFNGADVGCHDEVGTHPASYEQEQMIRMLGPSFPARDTVSPGAHGRAGQALVGRGEGHG